MRAVVIVGGGVIGWSVAYHLLKLAPDAVRVTVVEKNASFAMGSTGRAAGGVRAQFGTSVNIDMSLHSIRFFEEFEKLTGVDPSFRQNGYLLVTASSRGAEALERVRELQSSRGVPVVPLSNAEIVSRAPFLHCDDLLGGSYSPTDGYLDPYSVCQGFEKAARALGAVALYSHEAVTIETKRVACKNNVALDCDAVALCTGHWSSHVGDLCGLSLPVVAEKHQLAMTDTAGSMPEELPMVVDFDTSFHFRCEGAGLLVGWNDDALVGGSIEDEPSFDFGFLERLAPFALHRLPLLADIGFDTKRSWAGYYAETPDRHAIIGEMTGFFVATGFGGHGIMHSPAAGLSLAEILLGRSTTLDVSALSPQRFAKGELVVEQMVI